jgi:acyl-CoA dehydrogenase
MMFVAWMLIVALSLLVLAFAGAAGWLWAGVLTVLLVGGWMSKLLPFLAMAAGLMLVIAIAPALLLPELRRKLVTGPVFRGFRSMLPPMSDTERTALEAGTVGWDGQLFSGAPKWDHLMKVPAPALSSEEQAFFDTHVQELCALSNDWDISHHNYDMPARVWEKIKSSGILGMIIPKSYGGLGFSALAHSQFIMTLSTRCSATAVTVMVPNSLGPAELLMHYGTDAQKNHYLPRLAKGLDIPCFALTNPHAGSDAASIPDRGVVCYGDYKGERVLGFRVTFDKRYITLAPVATVIGLAFRADDPERLLGGEAEVGITCTLIPRTHPGMKIGRRHFPLNGVFMNGPMQGKDVFIPMEFVIGGRAQVGEGWKMLMNCLSVGRAISLPSSNVGMSKLAVRGVGGYARVRRQFRTAIGKFEGVEEALARMGGNLYMMDAARKLTAQYVDLGEKPAVLSGIVKYHITERARSVVNDGMDVIGGKGICLGPQNFLGRAYQQIPVGITVEGANILTRSLIIFGQGAIRCHPYVFKEMEAARDTDSQRGLLAFDAAIMAHVAFTVRNGARSFVHGLFAGKLSAVPAQISSTSKPYVRQLNRYAAAFALLSDVSMLLLGGELKRKEKLSARLGDVLSQMYLASATIKRFEDDGRQAGDAPLLHWSVQDALFRIESALAGVLDNYPNRAIAWLLRRVVFPLGKGAQQPSDALGQSVARTMIAPSASRERLTDGTFIGTAAEEPMKRIEDALSAVMQLEELEARLKPHFKSGALSGDRPMDWVPAALQAQLITADEAGLVERATQLTDLVIAVDDFPMDFGMAEFARHMQAHTNAPVLRAAD